MSTPTKNLEGIINGSLKMNLEEFLQLIDDVTNILRGETDHVGKMKITGRMIQMPAVGEATIVGDLHGDLNSLGQILKTSDFLQKAQSGKQPLLIFLGDYGDRGTSSPEVYYVVFKLKTNFPENVVLMRGNHEGPEDLLASPHDLPNDLRHTFGDNWSTVYSKLRELFNYLYNAVIVEGRCVLLHGGVPSRAKSLDDVAYAQLKHPSESHLEEILWSDPEEGIEGTFPSPRGAGKLFGQDVTLRFLEMLNVNVLIRGHEPCDSGFKINHSGRILTLFSRKGEPYFNTDGAYLQFDLAGEAEDAFQIKRFLKPI
jgi:diadenosine tetraphosphatase ApaH/serine/threonine PP2A family protein phosphatase